MAGVLRAAAPRIVRDCTLFNPDSTVEVILPRSRTSAAAYHVKTIRLQPVTQRKSSVLLVHFASQAEEVASRSDHPELHHVELIFRLAGQISAALRSIRRGASHARRAAYWLRTRQRRPSRLRILCSTASCAVRKPSDGGGFPTKFGNSRSICKYPKSIGLKISSSWLPRGRSDSNDGPGILVGANTVAGGPQAIKSYFGIRLWPAGERQGIVSRILGNALSFEVLHYIEA